MLAGSRVVAFLATSRPDDAPRFYAETLGLRLVSDDTYAIVFDANGVVLRIQKKRDHTPSPQTVLGWDVDDIRASVQGLSDKGVSFERFEQLTHDELGIWTSPVGARVAWLRDPDGNTLSLTQFS